MDELAKSSARNMRLVDFREDSLVGIEHRAAPQTMVGAHRYPLEKPPPEKIPPGHTKVT